MKIIGFAFNPSPFPSKYILYLHSTNGFTYHFHLSNYIQNILLYYKLFTILETQHHFKTHSTHNITITYILITKIQTFYQNIEISGDPIKYNPIIPTFQTW